MQGLVYATRSDGPHQQVPILSVHPLHCVKSKKLTNIKILLTLGPLRQHSRARVAEVAARISSIRKWAFRISEKSHHEIYCRSLCGPSISLYRGRPLDSILNGPSKAAESGSRERLYHQSC